MSHSLTHPAAEVISSDAAVAAAWLDRAILILLFALAFCAPHSIAATQTAWALALVAWTARYLVRPRPAFFRTPIDYPLLVFFALTVVSSFLSYDPEISIGKLRAASLFTIVYLVAQNVRSRRTAKLLALTLLASCMLNVIYTLGERIWGRGVKVTGISAESPLRAANIQASDTLLELDNVRLRNPGDLVRGLAKAGDTPAMVKIYRFELTTLVEVPRAKLLPGATPEEQLGVAGWSRGRDWRASGFYGHYTTYAEVLQLIASLACGLLVALERWRSRRGLFLALGLAGLCAALFLTVTRASSLSFLISVFVITVLGGTRRMVLAMMLCGALVVPAGLFLLQQKRNVSFFDRQDGSITWRTTVYREGLQLLVSRPRHLMFGIGMDSIKRYWRAWGMFDKGASPSGTCTRRRCSSRLSGACPPCVPGSRSSPPTC
ncbi:MAG: O-antigen ligase family protein [Pyrinomonadaceae bacterium]